MLLHATRCGGCESGGDWRRCARGMRYACRSRGLFCPRGGFLSLGTACAKFGDPICVLNSDRVPYVLHERDEGCYCFLGECYVDVILQGRFDFTKRELQTLHLH